MNLKSLHGTRVLLVADGVGCLLFSDFSDLYCLLIFYLRRFPLLLLQHTEKFHIQRSQRAESQYGSGDCKLHVGVLQHDFLIPMSN